MVAVAFAGIRLDAHDVERVADFWTQLLDWRRVAQPDGEIVVRPTDGSGYPIFVHPAQASKRGQNRVHFDLTTSSEDAMQDMITRACELGGGPIDIGQSPEEPHTVLADPEGNEFCVIPPDNRFLAGTGTIGAINCDGSREVGQFWSQALGWPLVWDQDEETAIQSPAGGSKITWSGPPLMPRLGRDRLRFVLETNDPLPGVIADLSSLGAGHIDTPGPLQALLTDPDGNEFHLFVRQDN